MKGNKKNKTVNDEKSRMEKIELAKFEFSIKQANGPVPITPIDVTKLKECRRNTARLFLEKN